MVRRALGLVALAVVLACVCGLLGRWQWNRHVARAATIAQIEASYEAPAVPLDDLLAPGAAVLRSDVWRPVTVVGQYDPAHTALLRNRPINGETSFHLLVPFLVDPATASGPAGTTSSVLVVDRGWVPAGEGDSPDVIPAPPAGRVEITVRLRASEPASGRGAPAGQVQAISVDQVLSAGGLDPGAVDAFAAYGALAAEAPQAAEPIGALPKPSTDPGSHLSYAFQWWTFALGSLIGFARLAWLEWHESAGRTQTGDGAPQPPGRRRRGPSAEDEEDALVDAQLP